MSNQLISRAPRSSDSTSIALLDPTTADHSYNVYQITQKNKSKLDLSLPTNEEIEECYIKTKAALQQTIESRSSKGPQDPSFIKYTPASMDSSKTKLIKIVEAPIDPMLPPKFKNNAKTPGLPDEMMQETAILKPKVAPLTAEEQKSWYIPPAISNWKNPKGFTIAIDKRLAAFDNKEKRQRDAVLNDNFALLAQSLRKADEKARIEIKARNRLKLKLAEQKKQETEEKLRKLALKARENRSKIGKKSADQVQRESDRRSRLEKYSKELKQARNKGVLPLNKEEEPISQDAEKQASEILMDPRMFKKIQGSSEHQMYDAPLFKQHEGIQNIYTFQASQEGRFKALGDNASLRDGEAVRFVADSEGSQQKSSEANTKQISETKKSKWADDDEDD